MPDSEQELIIIGAGLAGLCAALAAADAGIDVLVLEKSDRIGGTACWSYGAAWAGCNQQAADSGIIDDLDEVVAYLTFLGGGEHDERRMRALTESAPSTISSLRDASVPFDLMPGVNDILFGKAPGGAAEGRTLEPPVISGSALGDWRARLRTPPGDEWRVPKSIVARLTDPAIVAQTVAVAVAADQLAQGTSLIAHLLLALRARGIDIQTDCAVETLVQRDGRVTGVSTRDGRSWRARHGIILASGGYLRNERLVATLDTLPDYRAWCPDGATGDGLMMAAAIGAAVKSTRNNLAIMLGYDDPGDRHALNVGAPSVRELPRAHAIVVNAAGERFGNESVFQELAPALRAFDTGTRQPRNLPCWMIFDAQYVARWGFAGSVPGTIPDWVSSAPNLAELAMLIGVDPAGLTATAERFNGFVRTGVDEDYGRKPGWALTPGAGGGTNPSLGSIALSPFHAVRLFPTLGVGGGGIKADEHARVLDWRGLPIAGLYAAGDVAAHDEFGTGYQAGLTSMSAMTFAMRAVQHIATASEETSRAA